jgi:response regulator RpfG family c-di-GMP phosphodiesterase
MARAADSMEPATIVVVDDDPVALGLMEEIISGIPDCSAVTFSEPGEALAWCQVCSPDVIVSDYQMPGMDGLELLRHLRAEERLKGVPIMVVTSMNDREVRYRALEMGANDFLSKPLDAAEVAARIKNMILVRQAHEGMAIRAIELAFRVRLATASLIEREREVILRLSRAAEYRDYDSSAHTMRVAHFSRIIAAGRGLPEAEQELIFLAAPMHDVGKIGIPDQILLKPGRLDPAEFEVMKRHTLIGHRILGDSTSELLRYAAVIARTHHERMDGGGYPDGLVGEQIPLSSRIVAVADVFDAMTSTRPYQQAKSVDQAVAYLRKGAGTQFDASCVDAFLAALPVVVETQNQFQDAA